MKRIFLALAAALAVFVGANFNSASAATIVVDPNPTDSFHVGGFFNNGGITGYTDSYVFQLTKNADLTSNTIMSGNLTFSVGVFDSTNTLVSFTNLLAGALYTLVVSGTTGAGFAGYDGDIIFTQAAVVPVPPALLLFATSLVGFGILSYRRRKMTPTA